MLTRLRARALDGATNLVRLLDARRERDRLRETVECVCDERDEARRERDQYARLVATREVEIDELLRLRHEVERLTAERDEQAQGVSVLACRIDRVQQERDARIPTDIDGAQAWAEASRIPVRRIRGGWVVELSSHATLEYHRRCDAVAAAVHYVLVEMLRRQTWGDA